MLIGNVWPNSPLHEFTDNAGKLFTIEVHEFGLLATDEGGSTQLPHIEETADPDVILVAGKPFRRLPA